MNLDLNVGFGVPLLSVPKGRAEHRSGRAREGQMNMRATLAAVTAFQLALAGGAPALAAKAPMLPAGSQIYLELEDKVTSAHGDDDVGTIVRCQVWRDVESQGVLFVKGGTPATCRVNKVSHNGMAGGRGRVAVGAVETRTVDDQSVMLAGGYNKEGASHSAVVWTTTILLFWPAIFIHGGNAVIPPGTVFDASIVNDLTLASYASAGAPKTIDLRASSFGGGDLTADFMLDDFIAQPKHEIMRIKLGKGDRLPSRILVDRINDKLVDPIPVTLKDVVVGNGAASAIAEVPTSALAKHFVKGINRFDLSYTDGTDRKATEVIINVQM
jgi:hypothetical protein